MHDGAATEACMELAKLSVPILLHPMPLAGATSPLPPAGTILQHNVEVLSGLALFQAVHPGAPLIYAAGPAQLDMVSGNYADSADGNAMRLALVDVARFYNLPVNLGALGTASSSLDAHFGYEASSACLLAYLAGVDEIYSMGLLDSSQTLSLDKLVLDNHLARELEIMVQPIRIDEEHLAADLIERVGIGQHYLKRPETLASLRKEYVRGASVSTISSARKPSHRCAKSTCASGRPRAGTYSISCTARRGRSWRTIARPPYPTAGSKKCGRS